MHLLDWLILFIPLTIVLIIGIYTQHYMKSVADFMSGGRVAGRYLLAVAKGEMGAGAVVFVWAFEMISHAGFTLTWWQQLSVPVGLVVSIFGFVIYRYRETRVMTLAQFFEVRYSRSFRVFTGVLGFAAGILNFGIIPAVGARFLVYCLELPNTVTAFGHSIPTNLIVMATLLSITVMMTISGGLVTVMVADCVEGILSQLAYLVIICALLTMFSWPQIEHVLMNRPPGQSFLNPLDTTHAKDFNLSYVIMTICMGLYGTMAWQNASAYNSAALTAHESRMGNLLGRWREMGKVAVVTLLAVCAMTFLSHPDFSTQSEHARAIIAHIHEAQIQKQMSIPIAVSQMLPVGVKGLLAAILIMGIVGGDSTHLHSWGGILVQDVLLPLRKKPFTPRGHIRALRLAIIAVALFAFVFGSLFRQTEYVTMWFQVTTGIFVGGAGAAIIGGLYWKKGTTAGAWTSVIIGSTLSLTGIALRQIYGNAFPLNGSQIFFSISLISIASYAAVSLLTCKEPFNMDRMLHRGQYAIESANASGRLEPKNEVSRFERLIGIDGDFTKGDKWIAGGLLVWALFWFALMVVGTIWNLLSPWSTKTWSAFWHLMGVSVPIFFSVVTGVWFTWGGLRDIRRLFVSLRNAKVNTLDDGTVLGHRNRDEAEPEIKTPITASEPKRTLVPDRL
jgi:SSS family solute:Na+ symporter